MNWHLCQKNIIDNISVSKLFGLGPIFQIYSTFQFAIFQLWLKRDNNNNGMIIGEIGSSYTEVIKHIISCLFLIWKWNFNLGWIFCLDSAQGLLEDFVCMNYHAPLQGNSIWFMSAFWKCEVYIMYYLYINHGLLYHSWYY